MIDHLGGNSITKLIFCSWFLFIRECLILAISALGHVGPTNDRRGIWIYIIWRKIKHYNIDCNNNHSLALCGSSLWRFLIDILRTISEARRGDWQVVAFCQGRDRSWVKIYFKLFENKYMLKGLLLSTPTDQNSLIFAHHLNRDWI